MNSPGLSVSPCVSILRAYHSSQGALLVARPRFNPAARAVVQPQYPLVFLFTMGLISQLSTVALAWSTLSQAVATPQHQNKGRKEHSWLPQSVTNGKFAHYNQDGAVG